MAQKIVTIIGGTGFLGRYVVRELARADYRIRIISRHPDSALFLKTAGHVGQITLERGDITDPVSLAHKTGDSHAVVNLTGIMCESGRQNFGNVHAFGPEKLAELARAARVPRFIHVSALGVDKARRSTYARSKLAGEQAVLSAFPTATILRPSVMFGPEDDFFNRFADMAKFSPVLPLIGGGKTRFQPVYVGDVARAIATCLKRQGDEGCVYELGGPLVYSFRELMAYILNLTGRDRPFITVPFGVASLLAPLAQFLPPPFDFTADQVRLLRSDNVVGLEALTFADLHIHPTALEMIVPEYLSRFRRRLAA